MPIPEADVDWHALLTTTLEHAARQLGRLNKRPIAAQATSQELQTALGGPLADDPTDPTDVIDALAALGERGTLASPASRFFGFVIGGAMPAGVAADWLTTTWDQNAGGHNVAPMAMVAEQVSARWLVELLGFPEETSTGFVTGGQMANFTGLAAARHRVLERAGWDVQRDGLIGAPRLRVLVNDERHATIDRALRLLGLGSRPRLVAVDDQGRMLPDALRAALEEDSGPAIVCAQVGDVNTGAIDPVGDICRVAHERDAWVHVDGAFGLWAAASGRLRPVVAGIEEADSWATDAHKWLNVPYDCGLVFCAHPQAHRAAMTASASYLMPAQGEQRDALDWNPEFSRRARGVAVYAVLRALGRRGVEALVDRCCALARRFAQQLGAAKGIEICNEVALNQVLVAFDGADAREVVRAVQQEGTCWMSATTWRGRNLMRISVCNWQTDADDVDASVDAILRCYDEVKGAGAT